jgi:hypothetical protein
MLPRNHFRKFISRVLCDLLILFQAMFTGGLKECEMSRVKLQGVCPTAMARILHFMYTGQIRVTEVTVCQLLPAATMFQVCIVFFGFSCYRFYV